MIIHGVKLTLALEELVKRSERPRPTARPRLFFDGYIPFEERYDYAATGQLILKAWVEPRSKMKWKDGKHRLLEAKLNDLMIELVAMADQEIRWQELRVQREREQRVEEAKRWEAERRRESEARRAKDLGALATRWEEAERLREFVAALRARSGRESQPEPDGQLARWLLWADRYIDKLDPMGHVEELPPPYEPRPLWDSQSPTPEWPASS